MKFVSIASAKGLKVGEPVYTLDADGKYGVGRLLSRNESIQGVSFKFEVPQYSDNPLPVAPVVVENITHVAVMKDRKAGEDINPEAVNQ